jgi:uncharacterized membrane protein YkoI
MKKTLWTAAGIGAGVGAVTLGAVTFASAQNTAAPTSSSQSQQMHRGPGPHGTPLTGEDAEKATAAAQAEIPDGTVLHVETDADGTYEAHVRKADGTMVIVTMDADFAVTGVEEFTPGMGHHGPGPHETPLTGEDAEKATAAAQAEIPDGTVLRVETDADGTYEAHVRKADGTMVIVTMDADFAVTGVEEFTPRKGHRGHGPHGTPLTGQKAKKATSAVKARFPKATIIRLEIDPDGAYEAHIVKANGTVVEVTMNKNFRITDVERFGFGRGHMHPHPAPTDTATSAA